MTDWAKTSRDPLHIRYQDGAFCVFDGDRLLEECASETLAHARLHGRRLVRDRAAQGLCTGCGGPAPCPNAWTGTGPAPRGKHTPPRV